MTLKYKIKTVIIGLGNIGLSYDLNNNMILSHSKSVHKSKNFEIVAAVDKDKKKTNNFIKKYKKPAFLNIKSLVEQKIKFDFVIISTNTSDHFNSIKQLLNLNFKYCLLEKPGGDDFKQFKKILKIVKRKKIKILINYFRNYLHDYNNLKNNISNDNICYFFYNRGYINNCSHMLSLCLNYFGDPKNIKIIANYKSKKTKKDPSFSIQFKNSVVNFFNIGLKNCEQNKFLLFDANNMIESKDSLNSFVSYFKRKSSFSSSNYDYNEKKKTQIIKFDKNLQLNALNYIYKIFKSNKSYKHYYDLNYKTFKLLDIIKKKYEKNN